LKKKQVIIYHERMVERERERERERHRERQTERQREGGERERWWK